MMKIFLLNILHISKIPRIFAPIKRTFKKQFFVLTHSFLVVYQSVMHKYIKTVGERGVKLALYYIKCLQMIEIQAYARTSKPRWNTLF